MADLEILRETAQCASCLLQPVPIPIAIVIAIGWWRAGLSLLLCRQNNCCLHTRGRLAYTCLPYVPCLTCLPCPALALALA
jgi:hypothetical protein